MILMSNIKLKPIKNIINMKKININNKENNKTLMTLMKTYKHQTQHISITCKHRNNKINKNQFNNYQFIMN